MYRGNMGFADGNVGERPITRETSGIIMPTEDEVHTWLLGTLRHSMHVEYFLGLLGYGNKDPQRPHDLVGRGNKYEWEVVKGLSIQYRKPKVDFDRYISPSREFHRRNQYHHIKWNGDNPNFNASSEDMLVGAVDAVCALLENREYSGGSHSYDEIQRILESNPAHKAYWGKVVIPQMKVFIQPNLELITDLKNFPNIGLIPKIYEKIAERTSGAIEVLRIEQGMSLGLEAVCS